MKNLELSNFGVVEMNYSEEVNTNGGWLAIAAGLLISALDNFGDIADGFNDAINGRPPRHHHK